MTDPGRLDRRAQLAVLLERADRLTVDEAALLRTLVAELATTPVRITGDPMPQPQTEADLPACGCSCGPCRSCDHPVTPGMRFARRQRAKLFAMLRDGDAPATTAPAQPDITPQAGQPQADGPLVLDRAAATAMRDFLNQLLGDEATEEAGL